jgi:hypothetical protein
MMTGVRDGAWGFHVRAQRALLVRLGKRRNEHHELRREDERAAETPEPAPEAGRRGGGSSHHVSDTNDTTAPPASLHPDLKRAVHGSRDVQPLLAPASPGYLTILP